MSAYYAVAYEDRIELAVDGAMYRDDGTITALPEKFWISDRLPIVCVGAGQVDLDAVAVLIDFQSDFYGSVDGVIENLASALARNGPKTAATMSIVIACWSETQGPQLYWFTTYEAAAELFEGCEPFRIYNAGAEFGGGPQPSAETLAAHGLPRPGVALAECAVDLFEAMRETRMCHLAHPDKPMLYAVGGHVDLVTVRAESVTSKRLRTWPEDRVGHKISPASVPAFA
jgi:hypothetical protein